MTEPRLAQLYTGVHAHRDGLARAAGDIASMVGALYQSAADLRKLELEQATLIAGSLAQMAGVAERLAAELASGLERLSRLADDAMDDTIPIDRFEIARSNAEDDDPCPS